MQKDNVYICPFVFIMFLIKNVFTSKHNTMSNLINFKIYNSKLFGFNPAYKMDILIANIDHDEKTIIAVKEYEFPHPLAKKVKRYSRILKYTMLTE